MTRLGGVAGSVLVLPEQTRLRLLRDASSPPPLASRYSRSAAMTLAANGRILDLKNLVSRQL